MCLGLAYRQTLQGRTVFISYSGRVSLAESLCYRYALNGGANLSTWATKVHCGASALLGSVCNRAICHTAALHASMHPKPAQANSSAKGLLAPVWIDCDAGSDDALGIWTWCAKPTVLTHAYMKAASLQVYLWLLAQTLWGSHRYEATR